LLRLDGIELRITGEPGEEEAGSGPINIDMPGPGSPWRAVDRHPGAVQCPMRPIEVSHLGGFGPTTLG
jgi:hypothetical protein